MIPVAIEQVPAEPYFQMIRGFGKDPPREPGAGPRVADVLPAGYPSYTRVFHPFYRNEEYVGEIPETRTWRSLAEEAGVAYDERLDWSSLRPVLGGREGPRPYWVAEGCLDPATRAVLTTTMTRRDERVVFYFGLAAAISGSKSSLAYRAPAAAAEEVRAVATKAVPLPNPNRMLPIEYMFAVDGTWIVATDYDLIATHVASDAETGGRILADPTLETMKVEYLDPID